MILMDPKVVLSPADLMDTEKLNLEGFLPYRLSITSNAISDVIAGAYRSTFGLSIPEWRLITVLAERVEATQNQLGIITRMDKVAVSRAAIALVKRNLVRRSPNPVDGRSNLLRLTTEGISLYEQVAPQALSLEKEWLAQFSDREREQLTSTLLRLEAAAARLAQRGRLDGRSPARLPNVDGHPTSVALP